MSYLIAALISILVFSGALSKFSDSPPKWFSREIRKYTGFLLFIFSAVLLMKGRYEMAVPVGIAAILLSGYFDKLKPNMNGWNPFGRQNPQGNPNSGGVVTNSIISEQEAHEILGTRNGASVTEIRAAHKALIIKLHPDSGGNAYLASRVNIARDILLKSINH
jgi:hypothetical protein